MRFAFLLPLLALVLTGCEQDVPGCTNEYAFNYNSEANQPDGSCEFPREVYMDNYTYWTVTGNLTNGAGPLPLYEWMTVPTAHPSDPSILVFHNLSFCGDVAIRLFPDGSAVILDSTGGVEGTGTTTWYIAIDAVYTSGNGTVFSGPIGFQPTL